MSSYNVFKNFFRCLFKIFNRYTVIGAENIPSSGPVILASNHISNWDPMVLGSGIPRKVNYLAKQELFKIPLIGFLIKSWGAFEVKRGTGDRAAINKSLELLNQGEVLGIFIEGRRNTRNPGQMLKPHHGAAMLAVKSGAPVIPAFLINSSKAVFGFRRITVKFGPVINFREESEPDKKDLYEKISQQMAEAILKLRGT